MSFPAYIHQLTVTDTAVTPTGPLACGTAGDECATRLNFYFESPSLDSVYRLEVVCGDGSYDITDTLPLGEDGPVVDFYIPAAWTAAGVAAMRLVEYAVTDGVETARRYFPPVLLQFAYRDEGVQPTEAPLQWQQLLTRAEAVLGEAGETAAAAAVSAAQAEDLAVAAASEANGAKLAAEQAATNANAAARAEAAALQAENAVAYCESLVGITAEIKTTLGVME